MPAKRKSGRRATGRFGSREELACHIWAMRRQQVFPNLKAIGIACGVTTEVVKTVIETEEGLEDYLRKGCPTGAEPPS